MLSSMVNLLFLKEKLFLILSPTFFKSVLPELYRNRRAQETRRLNQYLLGDYKCFRSINSKSSCDKLESSTIPLHSPRLLGNSLMFLIDNNQLFPVDKNTRVLGIFSSRKLCGYLSPSKCPS